MRVGRVERGVALGFACFLLLSRACKIGLKVPGYNGFGGVTFRLDF